MTETRICVGALAGAFGVQGEVRLKSFCAEPEAVETYGALTTEDGAKSFKIEILRAVNNGFVVQVSGVSSKEDADALKGVRLFAERDALPSLPDDEFYHTDLIGLAVFDTGGKAIGTVTAVHNHGAGDLLEITGPSLKTPALLLFTQANVPTVDLTAGRVIVDAPEGAFSQAPEPE